jgi:cytochrome c-type biogenesis protein CcmF
MSLSTALVLIASAILTALILSHDFSNGYVFGYSDRSLPLHFLLSTFYAGQEGSFLFWALCSSLIAVVLSGYARKRDSEAEVMTVFLIVQTVLLALTVAKSPFRAVWDMYPEIAQGQVPPDGHGLNPLLQNFWMVIHPPVLFIGFALMAVPFSQAVGGLWKMKFSLLPTQGLTWILMAVSTLGLGIMLGAYWAYGVLGWGGYWGWDPVENSSLIPWLTGIALVHTLLAQRRTGRYVRTNFVLAIVSFFLVIYSTFLTRSGILGDASVHAFADGGAEVYWILLASLVAILLTGGVLLVLRRTALRPEAATTQWLTRETMLAAGAIALLLSAAVILFGTSLPIFSLTRVEPSFYDSTNLPLAVLMAFLIGLSLNTQWEEHDPRFTMQRAWKPLLAAFLVTAVFFVAGMNDTSTVALVFASFFALFVSVEVGIKTAKGDPWFLGGKIAHVGLAVFFLGVVAVGKYSSTEHVSLPRGVPVPAVGHTLTYEGFNVTPEGKYVFTVRAQQDASSFVLEPVMFDAGQQGIMRNPDIASSCMRDFYLSPVSLEPPQEGAPVEQYSVRKGDAVDIDGAKLTFEGFAKGEHGDAGMMGGGSVSMTTILQVTKGTERETLQPALSFSPEGPVHPAVPSRLLGGMLQLLTMHVGMGTEPSVIEIGVQRASAVTSRPDVLIAEASTKPFVNLLWGGTVLMMIGFGLAIVKRWRE